MADRRAVRNHLHSIHAIALANLAEVTSGLAITTGLPATARGIPTTLSISFLKKARGTLTAEARCEIPDTRREAEHDFESVISDPTGAVVARATVRWRIGPVPER
jgi:acyl-coenzyme A thioesterase PaaI-like protein